jgi:succinyl-diaminopimelate desuccinylase
VATLDPTADVVALTAALIDIPSQSHHEQVLADLVEQVLRTVPWLTVDRIGDTVVARTTLGREQRVVIGGHLDTVPAAGNERAVLDGDVLRGLGAVDMKGAIAISLRLAASLDAPIHDVTYLYYACEEVEARFNGLRQVLHERPELLAADFAILMEPSDAGIEAGCQGTVRALVRTRGVRAHSARSWVGDNAIHRAADVLQRLVDYTPQRVMVDGLEYREGMSAVGIEGGIAGNVIPDACTVTVNYRYAPSRTADEAEAQVRELFDGYDVEVVDHAPGALPGLSVPAAADFVARVGQVPRPKFGWTDVARFAELGVPAVNFGPGDPSLAHAADERVPIAHLHAVETTLRSWLTGAVDR